MSRRLYKSSRDKVLAGVCGGIGEYFDVDPVIIRILWVVSALFGGVGVLAYIIAAIIIPEEGMDADKRAEYGDRAGRARAGGAGAGTGTGKTSGMSSKESSRTIGAVLIALGAFFLLREFMPWISGGLLASALFIAIGILILVRRTSEPK